MQWSKTHAVARPAKMHQNAFIFVAPGVALLTPWMQKSCCFDDFSIFGRVSLILDALTAASALDATLREPPVNKTVYAPPLATDAGSRAEGVDSWTLFNTFWSITNGALEFR